MPNRLHQVLDSRHSKVQNISNSIVHSSHFSRLGQNRELNPAMEQRTNHKPRPLLRNLEWGTHIKKGTNCTCAYVRRNATPGHLLFSNALKRYFAHFEDSFNKKY